MKKIFLLFFILLAFFQCFKSNNNNQKNENQDMTLQFNDNNGINFDEMQKLVNNSNELNMEVFFAVSVLHKKYTLQLADQTKGMTEDEQKKFYDSGKKDFFKSIKYSEEEYDKFMESHIDAMNEYIINHKAIADYLNSENY